MGSSSSRRFSISFSSGFYQTLSATLISSLLLVSLPAQAASMGAKQATCIASDPSSMTRCAANANQYSTIEFSNDVICTSSTGCCTLNISGASNLVIEGSYHGFHREVNQRQCSAINLTASSNVTIQNLTIIDTGGDPSCLPSDSPCATTINVSNSNSVTLSNFRVFDAKGFAVVAAGTNGFVFQNSTIERAGIIGLYSTSNHTYVLNSSFAQINANAVVFQNIQGASPTDNQIIGNSFTQNHLKGAYLNQSYGKNYDGGQIFLSTVTGAEVTRNYVGDGWCPNCDNPMVWGVELGQLSQVSLSNNFFYDSYGMAFFRDTNAPVNTSDAVNGNVLNNLSGLSYSSASNGLSGMSLGSNSMMGSIPSNGSVPTYNIYRIYANNNHYEAQSNTEVAGTLEGVFQLSAAPTNTSPVLPIYRCLITGTPHSDFPSSDPNCEGQTKVSVLGYPYDSYRSGAIPFYRCVTGYDHFLSWDPNCEGTKVEGQLGYAIPGNTP